MVSYTERGLRGIGLWGTFRCVVVDLLTLVTTQNLVVLYQTIWAYKWGSPKNDSAAQRPRCLGLFNPSRTLRTHNPASPRPSLVAGPGTDSIPSLRSGIPMSQWISAAISRWERSSDSRCGRSSPPLLIYRHDATLVIVVLSVQRSTLGDRAFHVAASWTWNSLPPAIQTVSSFISCRQQLKKTHLFRLSFG